MADKSILKEPATPLVGNSSSFNTPVRTSRRMSDILSPAGRRLLNSTMDRSPVLTLERLNDDQAEKRKKLLESANKMNFRKTAIAGASVSHENVAEHYHNCLKLSAENKINTKNAFALHLIDYMDEMLKKKSATDFQLASMTIDASAKIYACRVDVVHADAYRVLANLSRGFRGEGDKGKNNTGGDDIDPEAEEGLEGAGDTSGTAGKKEEKKKRKKRRAKTIETNLKSITMNNLDMEFEVDPFFRRSMASFDAGNTSNLLLNTLRTLDDSSELILDPRKVINNQTRDSGQEKNAMVDISEFIGVFKNILNNSLEICPAFSDFTFSAGGNDCASKSLLSKHDLSRFRFDPEAEPVLTEDTIEAARHEQDFPTGFDDDDDGFGAHFHGNDEPPRFSVVDRNNLNSHSFDKSIAQLRRGEVSALKDVLSMQPSEFSYFKEDFLKAWFGPDRWKAPAKKRTGDKVKRTKPKEPFLVTFDEEGDEENEESEKENEGKKKKKEKKKKKSLTESDTAWHFRRTRRAISMNMETMLKFESNIFLLPEELLYNHDELKQLYFMRGVKIERQATQETASLDVNNYDYENNNDVNNYCPDANALEGQDNSVELGGCDDGEDAEASFHLTANNVGLTQQKDQEMTSQADGEALIGDSLVPQPRVIPRIQIDYAKIAKNIDVKKLKRVMSSTIDTNLMITTEPTTPLVDDPSSIRANQETHFSEVIRVMKGKLPKATSDELSTPIALFCLLHIANEENLKLTSSEDLSDIAICKD